MQKKQFHCDRGGQYVDKNRTVYEKGQTKTAQKQSWTGCFGIMSGISPSNYDEKYTLNNYLEYQNQLKKIIKGIIQAKYETQMLSRNTVRIFAMVGLPKENGKKIEEQVQRMILGMWKNQHPNISKENIHFSTERGHLSSGGDISGELASNEGIFQTFIDTGSTMSAVRDAGKKRIEVRTCVRVGVMSPILRDNNKNKYGRAVCSSYGGYFSSKTNESELRKLLNQK